MLLLSVLLFALFALVQSEREQARLQVQGQQLESLLAIKAGAIEATLQSLAGDILYLAQRSEARGWADGQASLEDVTRDFLDFARSAPGYGQVRLISDAGRELVRIDRRGGRLTVVPEGELQEKAQRPYVIEARQLPSGGIFMSPIDLNVERGVVERPLRPTLRFVTPLMDRSRELRGLIVLNYEAGPLLARLRQDLRAELGEFWLLDEQGQVLVAPDLEEEWTRVASEPAQPETRVSQAWRQARGSRRDLGELTLREGAAVFQTIRPRFVLAEAGATRISGAGPLFAVAIHPPPPTLTQSLLALGPGWLVAFVGIAALIVLGSGALSRSRSRSRQLEGDLEARERFARGLLLSAPDPVLAVTEQLEVCVFNEAASSVFGVTPQEVMGGPLRIFGEELERACAQTLRDGGTQPVVRVMAQRRDGEVFPASASLRRVAFQNTRIVMIGLRDVSEQQQAREDIVALNERLQEANTRLAKAHEDDQAQALKLADQSRELVLQQELLKDRNEALEVASRHKSEFLANMSHELRTPLNAILGFAELLLDGPSGELNETQRRQLSTIHTSGEHLLSLINSILDLAKIESGQVTLEREPLALLPALQDARDLVVAPALRKGLEVTFSPELDERLAVEADASKLRQILLNLLSNAVKFSPPQGTITIGAQPRGEEVEVWVRDQGPGVSSALEPKLFEPFTQGESPLTKQYEGTGLGLAICRQLVAAHGGVISYARAPTGGAIFRFTLPRAPSVDPIRPEEEERTGPLALIVEDDPASRLLLRSWLQNAGWSTAEASMVEEGWMMVEALEPDAVVLDLMLAGGSGLELLERIREDERTRSLPVVITSVLDAGGLTLEVDGYFRKPIDRRSFVPYLEGLVKERRRDEALRVLLIDDDPLIAEQLRPELEASGYELLTALTGEEGLERAGEEELDLLIVDLMLPGISGFEVVDALALDPRTRGLPVVVLTAKDVTGEEQEHLLRHAKELAKKGGTGPEALVRALDRAAGKRGATSSERAAPVVLVVDDNDINRELAQALLVAHDITVLTAPDGPAGIELARRERPNLILLDLAMPEMDGFAVRGALARDPRTRDIPTIAVTALAMPEDEERALAAGFDAYIAKPIDRERLLKTLDELLSKPKGG